MARVEMEQCVVELLHENITLDFGEIAVVIAAELVVAID